MNRTLASRQYLFSSLLECGLCNTNMVIVGGQPPNAQYGCPNHRYRGVCKNSVRIPQRTLEQQLLAALSTNLLDPRLEEERVQSFRDQLKATLAAEAKRTREAASQDSQLKEELAGLKKEQGNLVDGIAKHGFSPALSARLAAVESRIAQIQKLRNAGVEPKVPELTTEEIREFVQRKQTQDGSVFEVTGDVSLFQGNGDVMLTNSLEGIAEHYIGGTISLTGVVLNPSQPLAA
jgi:Recombinase zinc beta ribbon domain